MTNLSATFIPQFFLKQLLEVLPYSDYLFGNNDEVLALSKAMDLKTESVEEVAKIISLYEKVNKKRDRVVVFTQGSHPVVIAIQGKVETIAVPYLDPKLIIDTNGAGDAFVGGYLSQLVHHKDLKKCVEAGCYAAQTILQQSGCTLPEKSNFQSK